MVGPDYGVETRFYMGDMHTIYIYTHTYTYVCYVCACAVVVCVCMCVCLCVSLYVYIYMYTYTFFGPTQVLEQEPCPLGLPAVLTAAPAPESGKNFLAPEALPLRGDMV